MEGGGVWPVGGAWSTGSAGAIASDCGQVSAIRPNQEVCIYVSALPFSEGEKRRAGDAPVKERDRDKRAESLAIVFWTLLYNCFVILFTCYSLFGTIKGTG